MDDTSGGTGSGDSSAKRKLLDAAVDYVTEHGIADLSLRGLAAAISTSHRMLIFHFGSKEQLWAGIARTVAQRQGERLRELVPDPYGPVQRRAEDVVEAHLRPGAVAAPPVVLRAVRPGPPGPSAHERVP